MNHSAQAPHTIRTVASWLLIAAAALTGCVTLSPPTAHSVRTVKGSTTSNPVAGAQLHADDLQWHGSVLTARLEEQPLCEPRVTEHAVYQSVVTRQATGVGATVALSSIGIAVGVGALIAGGFLPSSAQKSSAQSYAWLGGATVIGGAIPPFIEGVRAARLSGDTPDGPITTAEETRPTGPAVPCGDRVRPEGQLVLAFSGAVVAEVPINGNQLTFDVEAQRDLACADESHVGQRLEISWKNGDTSQPLTTFDASDCIRAQVASLQLQKVREMIATAHGPERLDAAGPAMRNAERLIAALGTEHPRRGALTMELQQIRVASDATAASLLNPAIRDAGLAVMQAPATALDAVTTALELADRVPSRRRETTLQILDAYAKAATLDVVSTTLALSVVLERRPELGGCIRLGLMCPDWLPRDAALETLRPLKDAFLARVKAIPSTDARNDETALHASLDQLHSVLPGCRVLTWDAPTTDACAAADRKRVAEEALLADGP